MDPHPTIVVLAAWLPRRAMATHDSPALEPKKDAALRQTLAHAIQTHWRVVVVTTPSWVPLVSEGVATRDLVALSPDDLARGPGYAIATGVSVQADAGGWLLLPGEMSTVRADTLLAVGESLASHPVVYAQYRGRRGQPLGFAAELYSELVMLKGEDGAERLLARYPAWGVDVDDPGVVAEQDGTGDLSDARASGAA